MQSLDKIAKAILGALIAGLGALAAILVGGAGVNDVTDGQWVSIAVVTLTALGAVYGVPNAKQDSSS